MSETVSDILGKGFVFETREDVTILTPTSLSGTIPAFVGAGHWGPIGVPTLLDQDFEDIIGAPVVAENSSDSRALDFAGLAVQEHLVNSSYCYFTRVADGSQEYASRILQNNAESAELTGDTVIQNTLITVYPEGAGTTLQNNKFSITKDGATASFEVTGSTRVQKYLNLSSIDFSALIGNKIMFTIDSMFIEYTIPSDLTITEIVANIISAMETKYVVSGEDYVKEITIALIDEVDATFTEGDVIKVGDIFYVYSVESEEDVFTALEVTAYGDETVPASVPTTYYSTGIGTSIALYEEVGSESDDGVAIEFTDYSGILFESQNYGSTSKVAVYNFPGTSYNNSNVYSISGSNTSANTVINYINTQIEANGIDDVSVGYDSYGRIYILSNNTGSSESFTLNEIENSIYDLLGIEDDDVSVEKSGSDEEVGGKLVAKYTGILGNDIKVYTTTDENGLVLQVIWGSDVLGTFYDFSYNVDDDDFIGTLINDDANVSAVLEFELDSDVTSIPAFNLNELISLSGGTSGIEDLQDYMYISALNAYKNMDLYNIDIIAVPGNISVDVVDAEIGVCEERQDCFTVLDTPQNYSVANVIKWHNGTKDRSKAIDSEFGFIYYPWINVSVDNDTTDLTTLWVAPSVKVIGTITTCDYSNQNKYSIPAGYKNATLSDIEGLERYLTETEKKTLYADRLDNNINPIVYNRNYGNFIDGQKSSKKGSTPLNRIKAVRTSLYLKRQIFDLAPDYFWQPVDSRTRASLEYDLVQLMDQLVSDRVIKSDYTVDVTEELNDEYVEASGGLIAKIEWTPVKAVEKIKIINIIKDTQVSYTVES